MKHLIYIRYLHALYTVCLDSTTIYYIRKTMTASGQNQNVPFDFLPQAVKEEIIKEFQKGSND